jgi:hypothetical protein
MDLSLLVSIPIRNQFWTACVHPGTGKIVGVLLTTDGYSVFVVFDASTSEMVCIFDVAASSYRAVTFSASGAYCLRSTGLSYYVFDSNTGQRIVGSETTCRALSRWLTRVSSAMMPRVRCESGKSIIRAYRRSAVARR